MSNNDDVQTFSRRSMLKYLSFGGIVLGGSGSLLGTASAWGADTPSRGGSLSVIIQPEPSTLISAINTQTQTQYVAGKIYQGLLDYSADLAPQPALAKRWSISADGRTYKFELEENVKWHDGKPFTAEDAAFTIDKLLRDVNVRTRFVINTYIASVRAVSPYELEIVLKEPFSPFIRSLDVTTMPMMPKHLYENTDYRTNPANQNPVGTGPFMFKEWNRGAFIRLVRNPDYWKKGLPYLDEIVFKVIPDSASRAIAFERGDVHLLRGGDVDNVDVKRLASLANVTSTTKGWELFSPVTMLILNQRRPPFNNIKVRQAVSHAMNRKMIVDNIFFGIGKPATGPFASTTLFHDKSITGYDFNLKTARQLIKDSGVDVGTYPVKILSTSYGAVWDRLDEYIRQMLEQLGFKVSIESADAATWATRMGGWDFDMTVTYGFQYGDPALGVERFYNAKNIVKGSPFSNVQGYNSPAADALWRLADAASDSAERQRLYSQIQKTLVDDAANVWLTEIQFPTLYKSSVVNPVTSAIGLLDTFETVYIQKK